MYRWMLLVVLLLGAALDVGLLVMNHPETLEKVFQYRGLARIVCPQLFTARRLRSKLPSSEIFTNDTPVSEAAAANVISRHCIPSPCNLGLSQQTGSVISLRKRQCHRPHSKDNSECLTHNLHR